MDYYYSDDSDPEIDDDLQKDLDALRHSCILSGNDPDAAVAQVSSCLAAPAPPVDDAASSDDEEEEDDDLALVRSIRESLRLSRASPSSPLPPDTGGGSSSPRPICVWPPSDSEEEDDGDLETLRAIQRRFSHYHSGTSTGSELNTKSEATKGGGGDRIANRPDEEFDVEKQNSGALSRTGFPNAALLLVDALKKNRACQKFIRRKMINIEAKIEENKDLRDRVKCLMDYQSSCRRSFGKILCQKEDPRVKLISSRKPCAQPATNKDKKIPSLFLGPAENPHVSKYRMVQKQFPMSLQKRPWSDVEKEKLAKGVKQQYQETLILDSMNNGSSSGDFSAVDMAYALTSTAGAFEVTPESLRSVLPLINWDKIAAMYLPGRSGAECESRWLNFDDPLINHNAWSAREDKRLMLIVNKRGMHNWINIAVALGTHRTPSQCLARYQRSLNPNVLKRDWTKEEDLQLIAAVDTFGDNNWQFVSSIMDGRTGNQCSNRWRKTLIPKRTRVGRWYLDEDKRLLVSVMLLGSGSWSKIEQFIPGRTQSQCNERWRNVLDPDLDHGEWRPEEDAKLLDSVREVGRCWSKIAGAMIPHRSDNMCMRRFHRLCQGELSLLKATTQIKKTVFQSNFVDREAERPAIVPSDLLELVEYKVDRSDENTVSDQAKKPVKRSRISHEGDLLANDPSKSSACMNLSASDAAVNTSARRPRRKSSGSRSKKQTEENLAMSDGANDTPNGYIGARKRKRSAVDNNQVGQKRMRGSISADNEAVIEITGDEPISVDNDVAMKQTRGSSSVGNEGTAKRRRRPATEKNQVVQKRMRGSISVDNEAAIEITEGTIGVDYQVAMKQTRGSSSVGIEGTAKRRTRGSSSVGNEGTAEKRTRGSSSVGNGGTAKKRTRGSVSAKEGLVKKTMRGSISVGSDGAINRTMRASVVSVEEGNTEKQIRGSVSGDNHGDVASSRNLAEEDSTADGMTNAASELDLPSVASEQIDADNLNLNKGRRKSTPRPKQINLTEVSADKYSTSTRLANCMSFARINGMNRHRRHR